MPLAEMLKILIGVRTLGHYYPVHTFIFTDTIVFDEDHNRDINSIRQFTADYEGRASDKGSSRLYVAYWEGELSDYLKKYLRD
jgi:hypothetical protein